MDPAFRPRPPFWLSLLGAFYVINAFLLLFTTILFFKHIGVLILGKSVEDTQALTTRLLLVILPLYLADGIYHLRKNAWRFIAAYHLFFVTNGVFTILHLNLNSRFTPILEIALKPEYKAGYILDLLGTPLHIYILHTLGVATGILIIIYVLSKRRLFTE